MLNSTASIQVRPFNKFISVIEIQGELTGFAESRLMDAYNQVKNGDTQTVILNFEKMEYMNSSGIGLLITLLIRANRQGLKLVGVGLSQHFQRIFELTRLHEAIPLFSSEANYLSSLQNNEKKILA